MQLPKLVALDNQALEQLTCALCSWPALTCKQSCSGTSELRHCLYVSNSFTMLVHRSLFYAHAACVGNVKPAVFHTN